ncbi:MAG: hypothetical protein IPN32_08385 [Deltaproteobacteria bacterium]|nr:hypothetical protein [Deltaproteobacteria bacterium]
MLAAALEPVYLQTAEIDAIGSRLIAIHFVLSGSRTQRIAIGCSWSPNVATTTTTAMWPNPSVSSHPRAVSTFASSPCFASQWEMRARSSLVKLPSPGDPEVIAHCIASPALAQSPQERVRARREFSRVRREREPDQARHHRQRAEAERAGHDEQHRERGAVRRLGPRRCGRGSVGRLRLERLRLERLRLERLRLERLRLERLRVAAVRYVRLHGRIERGLDHGACDLGVMENPGRGV